MMDLSTCTTCNFTSFLICLFNEQFNHFAFLQEQASIGCHIPICTVSQTKLEVSYSLFYVKYNDFNFNFLLFYFVIIEVLRPLLQLVYELFRKHLLLSSLEVTMYSCHTLSDNTCIKRYTRNCTDEINIHLGLEKSCIPAAKLECKISRTSSAQIFTSPGQVLVCSFYDLVGKLLV